VIWKHSCAQTNPRPPRSRTVAPMHADPIPKLPHNPEAERSVLGAILLDNSSLRKVEQRICGTDFFIPAHRRIFAAMQKLAADGKPVEEIGLWEVLEDDPEVQAAGGIAYIAKLADGVPLVSHLERHADLVREKAVLRTLATTGEAIQCAALNGDVETARAHALAIKENGPVGGGLRVLAVEELLACVIKPREMLLDPILPEQGLAMLYAYRGVGKTYIALGIAAAVASGGSFLRWTAPRSRRVLYVDGELPAKTLQERSAMILAGLENVEPAPDSLNFITPDLQQRPIPDLATREGQQLIEPHLEGIALLVLDNLSALCRYGRENEGEGWLPVQEWALALRRRGISVLFIHHSGKNLAQRGTSRREDLLDAVFTLKHPANRNPSEGLRCEVHFEKTRGILGDAAKPFEVRMETGEDGGVVWTMKEMEDAKAQQAIALYAEGLSVRDVAEELGIPKSTAHRLRKKWMGDGFGEVSQRPNA
jgi:hypothetical protein